MFTQDPITIGLVDCNIKNRVRLTEQAPVVQKVDNAIYWINLYPVDSAICFP